MPDLSSAITLFPIPKKFIVPPIGQSFDLVGGQPKDTIALHVSANRLEKTPSEAGGTKYFHLKDTNALSDALTFSMSARGGGWGASYGMTADASALLQTSSLTQTIHFRAVAQKSQAMVTPDTALSAEAAKLLNEGIEIFTQRYGTHFVAGYVYGKRCNLSYHLNFSTRDLATKFSATFSESTSEFGFSESMKTSITNALTTSQSSCSFSVESDYRGFEPVSPQSITDLAKVVADYDKAAGDTAPILLVICPWTYLDQVNGKFGLPIDDTLADLAVLTNKLILIKQTGKNFIDSSRFAGDSQWKAILNAGRPVQRSWTIFWRCSDMQHDRPDGDPGIHRRICSRRAARRPDEYRACAVLPRLFGDGGAGLVPGIRRAGIGSAIASAPSQRPGALHAVQQSVQGRLVRLRGEPQYLFACGRCPGLYGRPGRRDACRLAGSSFRGARSYLRSPQNPGEYQFAQSRRCKQCRQAILAGGTGRNTFQGCAQPCLSGLSA